jgi:pyridoxine/pyridoxamine 5'-phosphate oxidase
MLLFRADENGFIFHTASTKDVFRQMKENPKAEMCFSCGGTQIRVTGVMEQVFDEELRAEIFAHPSRKFLQAWVANGIDNLLQVFIMKDCSAVTWTMETNFEPKKTIELK